MSGRLIVIEGGDGAGKATQAARLKQELEKQGIVTDFDFPQYEENLFGALCGRYQSGEFGDALSISPYLSGLPYILDQSTRCDEIKQALQKGNVICNRYASSSLGFQTAKLPETEWDDYIAWYSEAYFELVGMPRPSLVFYLAVTPAQAKQNVLKKDLRSYLVGEKLDQHESSEEYQARVNQVFRKLAAEQPEWRLIECMQGGRMRTRDQIHAAMMKAMGELALTS